MEISPVRLSLNNPEPRDASQNQVLGKPAISSQVEYLQPIKESQEVAYQFTEGDDAIEQSSHIAHTPQPVQGRHLSRPDVDEQDDFMATFEYAKPPSRKPDPKHPGLARGPQPLMSGFLGQLNVGSSVNTSRQGFQGPSATGHTDGQETISPNTDEIHIAQSKDFPQLPPTYEASALKRERPGIMGEADRSSKAQQSTMFSIGKGHHTEIPVESPATVENRPVDELPHGSPERPATESPKSKSGPLGDTLGSESSAGSPRSRVRHKGVSPRLSQRRKHRAATPLSSVKLPKALVMSRERALVQVASPLRAAPWKCLPKFPARSEPKPPHRSTARKTQDVARGVALPPRSTHRDRQVLGGDLAFTGTARNGVTDMPSHEATSAMRHQNQVHPPPQHAEMIRPSSEASNISRPRDPPPHALSQSGSFHQQPDPNLEEYNLHLSALSKKWNAHFSYEKRLVDRYRDSVAKLQEDLEDRDDMIQGCHAEIESRDAEIDILVRENEELIIARQQMETDLSESSQRVATMEEKLRSYRECLNNAMQEQQQLYKRCKEKCKETITAIKAEEKVQKEVLGKVLASSDSARISLRSKVASVIQEARNHSEQLGRTITELQTKLEEREKEIAREKERANDLRAQLDRSQSIHEQALRPIVSKNQEMLEKSDSQYGTIEELRILVQGQDKKLSGILTAVEESKTGRGVDPEPLAKSLQDSMTQTISGETMEQLKENINSIRWLCEGLREQLCTSEAASEWQERFHQVNLTAEAQMQRIQELDYELQQVTEDFNTQWEENRRLQNLLTEMKDKAQANEDSNTKIEDLTKQAKRLEEVVSEKDELINQSEEKVKVAEEKVRNQAHTLEEKEEEFRREGEEHKQSLETVIEERGKLRQQTNDLEKRIDDLRCENSQLEDDLAKARQEILLNQRNNTQLTEDLLTAEAQRESLRPGHQEWKRTRVEIVQIIQICQSLKRAAKDKTKSGEMEERLKELFEIQKRLSGKSGTPDGESSPEREPSPLRQRQVLLKIPGAYERQSPVSVKRERVTRRQPGAVRGIMKPAARSTSKEMNAPAGADPPEQAKTPSAAKSTTKPRVARRGSQTTPVIHSSYNRPVAGAVVSGRLNNVREDRADDTVGRGPTTKAPANNRRRPMMDLSGDIDSPPKKRQRGSTNPADQKTKLSRSKSEYFRDPSGEVPDSQPSLTTEGQKTKLSRSMSGLFRDPSQEVPDSQPSSTSIPVQPKTLASQTRHHRRMPGLVTYGSQSSHPARTESQTSIASSAPMRSKHGRSSALSSQTMRAIEDKDGEDVG
ncbi:hypothetical protein DL764_000585 [Monosporascus ibericus]|uniref:Uncharacterized protein n=1 Tax=Monosporascus ibericus TaxID=155417 RepID=A0A4Q4TT22_9PEZI|nr:hypothetical protein DL764_000585 [Monosporascus ibericus]